MRRLAWLLAPLACGAAPERAVTVAGAEEQGGREVAAVAEGGTREPEVAAARGAEVAGAEAGARGAEVAAAELWFGGDVHLGARGPEALAPIAAVMGQAAGVVNLEGPIDPRGADGGVVREAGAIRLFNGPVAAAALATSGVAAAGVVNNHDADAGPEGQVHTAMSLRAAGVAAFGGAAGVAMIERGGLRIALAGFDLSGGAPAGLAAALAQARGAGDVLAVGFHTSGPPLYLPEPPLREAAELALAAGASVVVAHGSHALAGAEWRGGAVIAWGLGNVTFACDCTDEREALALRVRLGRAGVEAAVLVPIDAGLGGAAAGPAADPSAVLDLLGALGVRGRRGADRIELVE